MDSPIGEKENKKPKTCERRKLVAVAGGDNLLRQKRGRYGHITYD